MKNTILVAILQLFVAGALWAQDLSSSLQALESQWAKAYYQHSGEQQQKTYAELLEQVKSLTQQFPHAVEPKIWEAVILSSGAANQTPLAALATLDEARKILEATIAKNPAALDGAAYVTLGSLYAKVPGWPVSFGDSEKAEQLLKAAVKANPNGMDANYFYADYLLSHDKADEALAFLQKAIRAPIRANQVFADTQLRNEAQKMLAEVSKNGKHFAQNKLLAWADAANAAQ